MLRILHLRFCRAKTTVADLEILSKGVDSMSLEDVRFEKLKEGLKSVTDDLIVRNSFLKQFRSGKYSALVKDYDKLVAASNHWGKVIGEVKFSSTSMNIVLEALSILGQRSTFSNNRAVSLFRNMSTHRQSGIPRANRRSYEIYLKLVADKKSGPKARLWNSAVANMEKERILITAEMFTCGILIYMSDQLDSRLVWKHALSVLDRKGLSDHKLLEVASVSAEKLKDISMMLDILKRAVDSKAVPVRIVALVVKLVGSHPLETVDDKVSAMESMRKLNHLLDRIKTPLTLTPAYSQQGMELCISLWQLEPSIDNAFLLKTVIQLHRFILRKLRTSYHSGILILAKVLEAPVDYKHKVFILEYAKLMNSFRYKNMVLWSHQNKIQWFELCCDQMVIKDWSEEANKKVLQSAGEAMQLGIPEVAVSLLSVNDCFSESIQCATEAVSACQRESAVPFLALLNSCRRNPTLRRHDLVMSSMNAAGIKPPVYCYDLCINLSCEADDLDSALRWFELLKRNNKSARATSETYTTLLVSACTVGDGVLALSLLNEITNGGITVSEDVIKKCHDALSAIDWRGDCAREFKEKFEHHQQHLLEAQKYDLLSSIPRLS